ncbi:MAG: ATP-binding protein [Odoribacter splanchnicus]|nr:ATP-binding protein [Odoribacter splanchnicus]
MNKLELVISSEVSNIVKVENFIENLTGHFELPDDLYGKISLSLIEAVNNAILSGNKQQADKKVKIVAELCDDKFMISVEDEGEGFDYENIPDPTLPDNIKKIAGRGLYLIKTLSDELEFEKGGAKVIMTFKV